MVNGWTMEHARWMSVLFLVCGFRSGSCAISLTMERTVTGVKGDAVVIPCTYTLSGGYDLVKILWEFETNPVIYRIDSQDHIPQVHNRPRVLMSNSPGDASLTLKKLDFSDRGNFKCKITGRDSRGKVIEREGVTILKVNRTRPITERPRVTTPPAKPTTRAPNTEDDSAIVNTKQPGKFYTSTTSANPLSTDMMHNDPVVDAIKGSGIFIYVLIIGLLCVIFILILTIVLIVKRRRRKSFHYDIPTMNQLALNLEGRSCSGGGCQSASNDYQFPVSEHVTIPSCSNDYEHTFPVSEYMTLPGCSNEYELLILQNPQDIVSPVSPSQ